MYSLPTDGIRVSIEKHNSDLMVASDWLQLVVLASAEEWAPPEIVDILAENGIYREQDFATEFVQSMLAEARRRSACLGDYSPLLFTDAGSLVARRVPYSALLFCTLLATGPNYSGWSSQFAGDYTDQGQLFERLVTDTLAYWFPSWDIGNTGWGDGDELSVEELVELLGARTMEQLTADWKDWVRQHGKDMGVDVAAIRTFGGDAGGLPVIMWQCASGETGRTSWPHRTRRLGVGS